MSHIVGEQHITGAHIIIRIEAPYIYDHMSNRQSVGKLLCMAQELSSVLCDDLKGWDGEVGEGRFKREGMYVYI